VRRPLPQDESKDRQVQREPNGQYHQYHHHEYLTVVSRLGFPDAGEPPRVHYLRDCFSCEDIPTGLSCSQAPLPPPQSGRSGAGATLSMRLAAALAGSRFLREPSQAAAVGLVTGLSDARPSTMVTGPGACGVRRAFF
jgi:hypothetical protein